MADAGGKTMAAATPARPLLLQPATVILLIGNLFPLVGVLLWGWDAFLLLTLYWMETVVIAVRTILQVAAPNRLGLAAMFTVHAGMFIGIHFIFLWALFSGDWPQRTGGVVGFFESALVKEGLWIPLLILGAAQVFSLLHEPILRAIAAMRGRPMPADARPAAPGDIVKGLYGRILVMQLTIILGAWLAIALGSVGPLILLILAKVAVEIYWRDSPMQVVGPVHQ